MSKKFTYEYVKNYIENTGYKLISTDYKNNQYKLDVQCPKRHNYSVTFGNFSRGQQCKKCFELKPKKKNIVSKVLKNI